MRDRGPNLRIGLIGRFLAPGWGCCFKCGTPWRFVRWHTTDYAPSSGCFPLCEKCWSDLTPQARLPFYRQLWDLWKAQGTPKPDSTWEQIEAAVLAESASE